MPNAITYDSKLSYGPWLVVRSDAEDWKMWGDSRIIKSPKVITICSQHFNSR